jgi:hypothetical protein
MSRTRLTDLLLAVIALCLVLIVFRVYDVSWDARAEAQAPAQSQAAVLGPGQNVQLVYQDASGHWRSLASTDGVIKVAGK